MTDQCVWRPATAASFPWCSQPRSLVYRDHLQRYPIDTANPHTQPYGVLINMLRFQATEVVVAEAYLIPALPYAFLCTCSFFIPLPPLARVPGPKPHRPQQRIMQHQYQSTPMYNPLLSTLVFQVAPSFVLYILNTEGIVNQFKYTIKLCYCAG